MSKTQFITIGPVTPKGKWTVCARRLGSKDRYKPIGTTNNEVDADTIVNGLNALQGTLDKLSAPNEVIIADMRETLTKVRLELQDYQIKRGELERRIDALQRDLGNARVERDAAQAKAREQA